MKGNLIYRLLAIKFNLSHMPVPVTKGLIELMKEFYSPEEARLVTFMPLIPSKAETIARLQFKNKDKVKDMLKDLSSRGLLVEIIKKGASKYQMAPFVPGIVEMQLMRGEDTPESRRRAAKINESLLEMHEEFLDSLENLNTSFARVIPVNKGLSPENKVLPYEDARAIINKAKKFAISHCYCRTEKYLIGEKTCDAPREICMSLDFAADFLIRNNIAKEVGRETMLEKLDLAEKHNLVHMTDNAKDGFTFICNCCGCCCGLLGASTRLDRKPATVSSSYIVEWDEEKCNHCGKCVRTCQINSLQWINKVTVYNDKRCIGCGECIDSCPQDALRLVQREGWREPEDTLGSMVADMMARRIKSGLMIPLKKLPGHKFIAKFVDNINTLEEAIK